MAQTRKEAATPRRSRDVGGSTATRPAAKVTADTPGAVVATAAGFYGGQRIKVGQYFLLEKPADFSAKWMRKVTDEPASLLE
jgi:hypothetical protein